MTIYKFYVRPNFSLWDKLPFLSFADFQPISVGSVIEDSPNYKSVMSSNKSCKSKWGINCVVFEPRAVMGRMVPGFLKNRTTV